jgi:hypothetical protein
MSLACEVPNIFVIKQFAAPRASAVCYSPLKLLAPRLDSSS